MNSVPSPKGGHILTTEDSAKGGGNGRPTAHWRTGVREIGDALADDAARERLRNAGFTFSNATWRKVGIAQMYKQVERGNVPAFVALSNIEDGKPINKTEHSGLDGKPFEIITRRLKE